MGVWEVVLVGEVGAFPAKGNLNRQIELGGQNAKTYLVRLASKSNQSWN